jgi:cell division septal protein FtsQ
MYTLDINDKLIMRSSISDIQNQILNIPIIESALIRRILWQNKIAINFFIIIFPFKDSWVLVF